MERTKTHQATGVEGMTHLLRREKRHKRKKRKDYVLGREEKKGKGCY